MPAPHGQEIHERAIDQTNNNETAYLYIVLFCKLYLIHLPKSAALLLVYTLENETTLNVRFSLTYETFRIKVLKVYSRHMYLKTSKHGLEC